MWKVVHGVPRGGALSRNHDSKTPRGGPASDSSGKASSMASSSAEEIGLEMTGSNADSPTDTKKAPAEQKGLSSSSTRRGDPSLGGIFGCSAMTGPMPLSIILAAGSVVLALSMGTRHVFGVFLAPLSKVRGWNREVFGLAVAVHNLVWGVGQPLVGALADHFGAGYVVAPGALCFAVGLVLTPYATQPWQLYLTLGVLVGVGMTGTAFPIIFGTISRALPSSPSRRSRAMGVVTALTSASQFLLLPLVQALNTALSPSTTLVILGLASLLSLPAALFLLEKDVHPHTAPSPSPLVAPPPTPLHPLDPLPPLYALRLALNTSPLWLLSLAFFTCGFHIVFIGTHLAAFLADQGQRPYVAIWCLSLIGLFNVPGTYSAGVFGAHINKTRMLAGVYVVRAVAVTSYILTKITPLSSLVFAAVMGLCWLTTVPLTNALLASIYGGRHMSMVSGVAFFFHQVGSFLGGWLGGVVYDQVGSYTPVWMATIAGGLVAALLVLPVKEEAMTLPLGMAEQGGALRGAQGDKLEALQWAAIEDGESKDTPHTH